MPLNFNDHMENYLTTKRRKKTFSGIKSKIMNKKAVLSYKAINKLGGLKGKLISKVNAIRNKKKEVQNEITQGQINNLVENKGIVKSTQESVVHVKEVEEGGWKEVKLEQLQEDKGDLSGLEGEKKKIQETLARIGEKREVEKSKIIRLSNEKEQMKRVESEEEKAKRLALEEEVMILKEKQKIEEDRLAELKRARKHEQMDVLRGRVTDILFKKHPKREKNMVEEVRKEVRMEAKVNEAERKRVEVQKLGKPKEDVTKEEEKSEESVKSEEVQKEIEKKEEVKADKVEEVKKVKEKKPRKSFLSRFIQIKSSAQIAKDEEERLKQEEEQALRDQSNIANMFQNEVEVKSNVPPGENVSEGQNVNVLSTLFSEKEEINTSQEEQDANISTLFPDENTDEALKQDDTIDLGEDYKIKVVRD